MMNNSKNFCALFVLGFLINTSLLYSQEVTMAPQNFIFSWQKANGDQYDIPVENNLEVQIVQQRVNRALMQILLKSVLKSRDFEGFDPLQVTLLPDEKNQVAIVKFSKPDNTGETQQFTYYFTFDTFGNVFSQL
jgi:hypothetical protein